MNTFKAPYFIFVLAIIACLLSACKSQEADLALINGRVFTLDDSNSVAQAIAIKDGKIVGIGTTFDIQSEFVIDSTINLKGYPVYPGLIDAHCHFVEYAKTLNQVDLKGTQSWEEVILRVEEFTKKTEDEWIVGFGWDQNEWDNKQFPSNRELNIRFPNRPVILSRIDGHAAIANAKALKLAGITPGKYFSGGYAKTYNERLTGLLLDNAVNFVLKKIPELDTQRLTELFQEAEKNCFAQGLTTLDEAGLDFSMIQLIDSLQKVGVLNMRFYAMLNPTEENKSHYLKNGPYKTDQLNVRSFKYYADGSLGSRGACLLQSYSDAPGNRGFLIHNPNYYQKAVEELIESGFQMNTHCIGDSANRMITRLYGNALKGNNDRRWRIEHAQMIHPKDFTKFKKFSILPSVQPTHATSDMYWVEDRIGKSRLESSYAYKTLLDQNGFIAFGSDFPVESINPFLGIYAAVTRKDLENFPYKGFLIQNAVSAKEALLAMTRWAAFANFEEKEKGSLEIGKLADIVVVNHDVHLVEPKKIPETKVVLTLVGGKVVHLTNF